MNQCPICSESNPAEFYATATYCKDCYRRYHADGFRGRINRTCANPVCGKVFVVGQHRRYCSPNCHKIVRRERDTQGQRGRWSRWKNKAPDKILRHYESSRASDERARSALSDRYVRQLLRARMGPSRHISGRLIAIERARLKRWRSKPKLSRREYYILNRRRFLARAKSRNRKKHPLRKVCCLQCGSRFTTACKRKNFCCRKHRVAWESANLVDTYVARTLSLDSGLQLKDLPHALVEAKRQQLKLKRLCQNLKT